MDFTGSQMVLTLKIISAAVVYQDGLLPEKVHRQMPFPAQFALIHHPCASLFNRP